MSAATDRLATLEQDLAEAEATRRHGVMLKAREHRERAERERQGAHGRIVSGEPGVDLDQLRTGYLAAVRAHQDASLASHHARVEADRLLKAKPGALQDVGVEALRPLLAVRAALAAELDAALEQLVAVGQLYLEAAHEANRLAAAADVADANCWDMRPWVHRRVFARIRGLTPQEWRGVPHESEKPAAEFDAAMTDGVRQRLEEREAGG